MPDQEPEHSYVLCIDDGGYPESLDVRKVYVALADEQAAQRLRRIAEMPKKKKALPPRVKRMNRSGRLQSARHWLSTYDGKNIAAGYRKHFAVDWGCAFKELEILGVKIDADYKTQILKSVEGHIVARKRRKARRKASHELFDQFDHDDHFAYIAGYTAGGFAYGITWEQWDQLNQQQSLTQPIDSYEEWEQNDQLIDPESDASVNWADEPEDIPF